MLLSAGCVSHGVCSGSLEGGGCSCLMGCVSVSASAASNSMSCALEANWVQEGLYTWVWSKGSEFGGMGGDGW